MGVDFDWDPAKDAAHIEKHGIAFEDAEAVFTDPNRLEEVSRKAALDEDRWLTIGMVGP